MWSNLYIGNNFLYISLTITVRNGKEELNFNFFAVYTYLYLLALFCVTFLTVLQIFLPTC